MRNFMSLTDFKNIAFISTRIAGTDGVSLEIEKWADVFEQEGFTCYYFAGELDRPQKVSYLVPEAHFTHPDIKDVYLQSFGSTLRDRSVSKKMYQLAIKLKDELYEFVEKHDIHIIIPENALTIPLNIPLGIALTEFIAETNIHTIAQHHDFYWERDRFMINAVQDYLNMAFPPVLPSIHHVVINSVADSQLSLRTGVSAHVAPNVMDFANPRRRRMNTPQMYARRWGLRKMNFSFCNLPGSCSAKASSMPLKWYTGWKEKRNWSSPMHPATKGMIMSSG